MSESWNKSTTEEAIARCVKAHGGFYSYNKETFGYTHNKCIVNVVCPMHGNYPISYKHHVKGKGLCPECRKESTLREYIHKANIVHDYKYDYSEIKEFVSGGKGIVICKKHGPFEISFSHHLSKRGCKWCHLEKVGSPKTKDHGDLSSTGVRINELIASGKANFIALTPYVDDDTKMLVRYVGCGCEYYRTPQYLCKCQKICKNCKLLLNTAKKKEEFSSSWLEALPKSVTEKFVLLDPYVSQKTRIRLQHKECGGVFSRYAEHIKDGLRCMCCEVVHGFNLDEASLIYYLKFNSDFGDFWKIGVTNRTVADRFKYTHASFSYEILHECGGIGHEIVDKENEILNKFVEHKLSPPYKFDGYTECFNTDISKLPGFFEIFNRP